MKRPMMIAAWLLGVWLAAGNALAAPPAPQARLKIAEAMFQERCKKAGEFIHRTVDGVEGVFLMKIRPGNERDTDQFAMYDPYGHDSTGETFLKTFFSGFYRNAKTPPPGYAYVEAIDPADGKRYRYTGSMKVVGQKDVNAPNVQLNRKRNPNYDLNNYAFKLDKVPSPGAPPRYGVTYEDISTREEREYWIAGSSLKVVDLETQEVIAERVGYMMDRGQGNRSGFRSPWLLAADHACPEFPMAPGRHVVQTDQTRNFVTKVLKPKLEH